MWEHKSKLFNLNSFDDEKESQLHWSQLQHIQNLKMTGQGASHIATAVRIRTIFFHFCELMV